MSLQISSGIRWPGRIFLAFGLIFMLLQPIHARAQDGAQVKMEAWAGFDGSCRDNTPVPVRVRLENSGQPVLGQVEVRLDNSNGGTSSYIQPLDLPTSSRKETFLYVYPEMYLEKLTVILSEGGNELAKTEASVTCLPASDIIFGVLAQNGSPLNLLSSLDPPNGNAVVAHLLLEDIPDQAYALQALDALFIAGIDTGALSASQKEALNGWVAGGGQLVIAGGPDWKKTSAGLDGLLPVEPTGLTSVNDMRGLQNFTQSDQTLTAELVAATGELVPGAQVLAETGGVPIVVSHPVGFGSVIYLAADPTLEPLRNWDDAPMFFQMMLSHNAPRPSWAAGLSNWDAANSAISTLVDQQGPGLLLIFAFLGLYVVVVGPVNWLLVHRLKRRELAWFTIPAAVILFSLLAFVFGGQARGSRPILHRLAIVQVWPEVSEAKLDGLVGLFSPRRDTFDLEIDRRLTVHPIPYNPMLTRRGGWVIQDEAGGPTRLNDLRIDVAGLNAFALGGTVPAPALESDLTLQLTSGGASLKGEIINNSSIILQDTALIAPGGVQHLGDLKPGERREVQFDLQTGRAEPASYDQTQIGPWAVKSAPTMYASPYTATNLWTDLIGTTDYYQDSEAYRRYMLLNATSNYGFGTGSAAGGVYLSAWNNENSPIEAATTGKSFDTEDLTVYFFAMPIDYEAASDRLEIPPGLFTWSVLENNPAGSTAPYDAYLQDGGYSLAFQPAHLIEYSEVQELILNLQSYSVTGPTNLDVSLWDWEQGKFVDQAPMDWGSHSLPEPARYVGPGGEIRLQLNYNNGGNSITLERADFTLVVKK